MDDTNWKIDVYYKIRGAFSCNQAIKVEVRPKNINARSFVVLDRLLRTQLYMKMSVWSDVSVFDNIRCRPYTLNPRFRKRKTSVFAGKHLCFPWNKRYAFFKQKCLSVDGASMLLDENEKDLSLAFCNIHLPVFVHLYSKRLLLKHLQVF